jgi:hypothetical protein
VGPAQPALVLHDDLAGPAKIDLICDQAHPIEPPWPVNAATIAAIDDHFWDRAFWLASSGRRNDVVTAELVKLHAHLLAPLGVGAVPDSLDEAAAGYKAARDGWENDCGGGCRAPRRQPCYRARARYSLSLSHA